MERFSSDFPIPFLFLAILKVHLHRVVHTDMVSSFFELYSRNPLTSLNIYAIDFERFFFLLIIEKFYLHWTQAGGTIPCLNSCHNGPFVCNSRFVINSNIVTPKLNISAALVNSPFRTSGAIYRQSPSVASLSFG